MFIVTNNPKVYEKYNDKLEIEFIDGDILSVFTYVRNLIHKSYALMNHPLYGSIKPNETPFRTILLEKGVSLDFDSLDIIENSILSAEKFIKMGIKYDEENELEINDFTLVDFDLIKSSIEARSH